ncbi:MAG: metallophosphoesterase family protein [Bacteroidales bacterium]|nr:metallophosphoesterase family protein [Bacteroidales bacterium]
MKNYWYIGDIHGEIGLLESLLAAICKYKPHQLVFLGDYIDRGPHAREVIDCIMELDIPVACLMGNHELMMLNALEDSVLGNNPMELWYRNGGEATLQSFGYPGFFSFQSQMEEHYLEFFRSLLMSHVREQGSNLKILATHAGISPAIPVADQLLLKDYLDLQQYMLDKHLEPGDSFLWTREDFFECSSELWKGYLVVHGHTPTLKLKRFVEAFDYSHYHFVGDDLAFRMDGHGGKVVSVGIDSGSTISGRLTGMGFFTDSGKGEAVHMRSLTVTREDIIPRDLGPIGP